jgi:hypothetical protein
MFQIAGVVRMVTYLSAHDNRNVGAPQTLRKVWARGQAQPLSTKTARRERAYFTVKSIRLEFAPSRAAVPATGLAGCPLSVTVKL